MAAFASVDVVGVKAAEVQRFDVVSEEEFAAADLMAGLAEVSTLIVHPERAILVHSAALSGEGGPEYLWFREEFSPVEDGARVEIVVSAVSAGSWVPVIRTISASGEVGEYRPLYRSTGTMTGYGVRIVRQRGKGVKLW